MKPSIKKKLQGLVERHEEVSALLAESEIISQQNRFRELSKEYAQLEPIVAFFTRYETCLKNLDEAKERWIQKKSPFQAHFLELNIYTVIFSFFFIQFEFSRKIHRIC